jgi:hypothetical protein
LTEQRDRKKGKASGRTNVKKSTSQVKDLVWKIGDKGAEFSPDTIIRDMDNRLRYANKDPPRKHYCNHPFDDDEEVPPGQVHCGKPFKRLKHFIRHKKTHNNEMAFPCWLCKAWFDRNDNRWAHAFTHVHQPGKKDGRNKKFSLRQVTSFVPDPKQVDKLLRNWDKEVKSEYRPEQKECDNPLFMKMVKEHSPDLDFKYDADEACLRSGIIGWVSVSREYVLSCSFCCIRQNISVC